MTKKMRADGPWPRADGLRELRRATKAVKEIKRDLAEILGTSPAAFILNNGSVALPPGAPLPENYSYVRCVSCGSAAFLIRDNLTQSFAAACLQCSTVTHIEAVIDGDASVSGDLEH